MSRGLKKLLALCLVAVMLTAVIAGCGQKTEDPAGDDPVQQDPVEQPTQPEPEEEEPEPEPEEVRDLGGRVIRVAAWWDMTPRAELRAETVRWLAERKWSRSITSHSSM